MLEKLTKSPDAKFTAQWNEAISRLVQLEKMRVGAGLILAKVGGVPCLALSEQNNFMVGKADADIDPLSGATPGYGDVTPWIWDADAKTFSGSAGDPVTGFNLASSAVTAGKFLVMVKVAGAWLIIFEDCGS